jgi:GNAT superfamily N-acetyltransferase
VSALYIEEVTRPEELALLLALPHRLYARDPRYVPALDLWVRRRLAKTNAFFRNAELKLFVARRGREVVGSISALHDRAYAGHHQEQAAFFGFFESEDDRAIAHALLERAATQARAWGATVLRGPRNLTRVEDIGLTVEGHDTHPPVLAGHHPPHYQALIESFGFTKHHDMLAYEAELFEPSGAPRPPPGRLREKVAALDLPNLEVRPVSWLNLSRDLTLAHEVFVEAYRTVPDAVPMPREQFVALGRAFLAFTSRHMLQLATVNGRPAGLAACVPELNEAIVAARGRVLPLGWARALKAVRSIRTASFKLIGVMPEFRSSGLHARLILAAVDGVRQAGYTRMDASVIHEDNARMRSIVEDAGCSIYRRYRVYDARL